MNIAIILAGGTGSRMGADRPKQFLTLDGRMVIERSIDVFDQSPLIDEVAVVVHPDWMDFMQEVAAQNNWPKLQKIIPGGSERYMSSLHAIQAYEGISPDTNLLFHDAARPWVSNDIISRVVESLYTHEAVGVAVPSTDTIWQLGNNNTIEQIPNRSVMWRAQTPQSFRFRIIEEAYRLAMNDPMLIATDDCGVVMKYLPHIPIVVVPGSEENKKITFKSDL